LGIFLWFYSYSELEHKIIAPNALENQSLIDYVEDKQDWDQNLTKGSMNFMLKYKQKPQCYWTKTENDRELANMIGYPELDQVYEPPEKICKSIIQQKNAILNPDFILWIFIAIIVTCILLINVIIICVYKSKIDIQFKRF